MLLTWKKSMFITTQKKKKNHLMTLQTWNEELLHFMELLRLESRRGVAILRCLAVWQAGKSSPRNISRSLEWSLLRIPESDWMVPVAWCLGHFSSDGFESSDDSQKLEAAISNFKPYFWVLDWFFQPRTIGSVGPFSHWIGTVQAS